MPLETYAPIYVDATEPSSPYAGMLWYNTSQNRLYIRNAANTAWLVCAEHFLTTVVSANLRQSNDAEKYTASTTYVKVKEIKLNMYLKAVTVKFDMKSNYAGVMAYAKVYVNGVAVGTEWSQDTTTYATYTQDFSVGYEAGALIQVYAHGTTPRSAYVKNLRLYFDFAFQYPTVGTNQDP